MVDPDEVVWRTPDEVHALLEQGDGEGVRVAVVDSGIDLEHACFEGRTLEDDLVIEGAELGESKMRKLKIVEGNGKDVFGHGTAVAGIIWDVAPKAQIGSIRVLGYDNRSKTDIVCFGVQAAMELGYDIVNCSLGCGRPDHLAAYKQWVDDAYLRGIHVVAACNNANFRKPEWPGHFASVNAVNMARVDELASIYYRPGNLIEFAARGVEVEVPWRHGRTIETTGSSFAAPRVAGLLARMLSVAPELHPLEAKAMLRYLAEPWTPELSAPNEDEVSQRRGFTAASPSGT